MLISLISEGQTYTRGKKNIGFTLGAGQNFANSSQKAFKNLGGHNFNIGISTQLGYFIYPSLIYKNQAQEIQLPTQNELYKYNYHSLALPVLLKIPVFGMYLGKSKKYECKGAEVSFILGPEYSLNFGSNPDGTNLKNTFFIDAGLEFLPSKSGGSKQNKKWTTHIDLIYKYGVNKYLSGDNLKYYNHQLTLQFSVIKHQVYKFSNM